MPTAPPHPTAATYTSTNPMKNFGTAFFIIAPLATLTLDSLAQVSVTSGTYTQNFDGLAVSGTSQPWVNNATLPGWSAYQVTNTTQGPITSLVTGQSSNPRLGWYGNAQDYSLGSGYTGSTGNVSIGLCLVNDTGATVNSFSVDYTGEQWFRAPNSVQAADSLTFSYQIFDSGTGSLAATNWITVPGLDFISPNATANSMASLNGNASENRITYSSWIADIALADGQELWLRWTATDNEAFNDHGLAIDDLTVTFGAIPEPAAYAAVLSSLTLLAAGLRRRGRKTA